MPINDTILSPPPQTSICVIAVREKDWTSQHEAPSCRVLLWFSSRLYFQSSKRSAKLLQSDRELSWAHRPIPPSIGPTNQPTAPHSNQIQNITKHIPLKWRADFVEKNWAHTENLHSCNNHISVQSGLKANTMELSASEPLGSKPDKYLDPFKTRFWDLALNNRVFFAVHLLHRDIFPFFDNYISF